ncbi:MAG: S8 family serine peptidase [Candidatus Zixiibacteriota bacterium]|nr:MAG: S8 family serine peptidase [candidate division Zixibacteria bacterium]
MRIAIALAVLLSLPATLMAAGLETAFLPNGAEYLVDRFIVTTMPGTPPLDTETLVSGTVFTGINSIDNLCASHRVVEIEPFYDGPVTATGLKDIVPRMYILHVEEGIDVLSAYTAFKSSADIEFSDLYDIPHLDYTPNDPSINAQWHLNKVEAYNAWDVLRGDTTRVAIISICDTGIYWMHPDLAANMWINEPEDLNGNGTMDAGDYNGLDDDGNGYVDDVIGWDNGNNDNDPREDSPIHGTHVAGCVSEVTDNGLNGASLGFSARVMANKGANYAGQLTAVYPAMIWAANNGAHIINCSWGSSYYSSNYQSIINGLWAGGVLVVAAAGNVNNTQNHYPAAYNHVLAVAATNQADIKASFSSYGSYVDVSAPGVGIYATWATNGFIAMDGTSMAAPVTAGLAGLLKAADPSAGPDDISDIIIASADNIDDINPQYAGRLGSGRINAYSALASANTPNIVERSRSLTITDDDGDGILNPGESFELVLTLENIWADAENVVVTLTGNDDISFSDGSANFGNISHGGSADNFSDPFDGTVSADNIPGPITVNMNIQADGGYNDDVDLVIETSLYLLNFPLDIPGNIESSPLIFDVDVDGSNEIIVGSSDDNTYVIEADGQNSNGWPKSASGDILTGPAVGNLDALGGYEVVAISKNGNIYAWNTAGNVLPGFPVNLGGIFYSGVMLADIDGDYDLEIIAGSFANNNIYVLNHDGSNFSGWPVAGSNRWYGSPASGDLDGDGDMEIIYAGFDSSLHAYNFDGNEVTGFPVSLDDVVWGSVAVSNLDGDPDMEIAVVTSSASLYVINHDGSIANGYPVSSSGIIRSSPSLADIDGDGDLDVIFGGNDGEIHVFDVASGSEVTGFPQSTGGSVIAAAVVGDITGDSQPDIIVGTGSGTIFGFAGDGSEIRNFPMNVPTSGQITSTAALGDLDGDGDMEIVFGVKSAEQNLIVLDYKESASENDLQWPNFGYDIWRSHNSTDVVTSADEPASVPYRFGLSQNYPNPFNAQTTIEFALGVPGEINLSIYDLLGRKIVNLKSGMLNAGRYSLIWDGTNGSGKAVASGIYFYRLESLEGSRTMRMLLLK